MKMLNVAVAALSLILLGGVTAAQQSTAEKKVSLDIPARPISDALNDFAHQAGLQVVFYTEIAKGLTSPPLKGSFTREDALAALLQGTGLVAYPVNENTYGIRAADSKTSAAVTATQTGANASRVGPDLRVAQSETATMQKVENTENKNSSSKAEASSSEEAEESSKGIPEVLVTGSRIRSLVSEQTDQPVLSIDSAQIERYGISSLAELFRYIPQVSSYESGLAIQAPLMVGSATVDITSNRISATLRGAPAGGTLLLVNGRRVPKTGQENGRDAYDLAGIPLAAIDRVDVLLDGASAVYGADAVGGVINVILKKNYRGSDVRVGYENTFDSDVHVKTASLTHGFSHGRFSGLISGSWESAGSMTWQDRWFLRTMDRRPFGGQDLRSTIPPGGTGALFSLGGNLPGLSVSQVAIPKGATGTNLTVPDFANAGPVAGPVDTGLYNLYSTPYRRLNLAANAEFEFAQSISLFAEAGWSESEIDATSPFPFVAAVPVPAGAPGNPFGVPVLLLKYFFDVPAPITTGVNNNESLAIGGRGVVFGGWRYDASMSFARSSPDFSASYGGGLDMQKVANAFANPNPAARPILIYDSTTGTSPNAPGTLEALSISPTIGAEQSEVRTYAAQTDGSPFELPSGPLRIAAGLEYREEYVEFPAQTTLTTGASARNRYTFSYFAETRIPILSGSSGILLNSLEVSLAARHDGHSDFPGSTNPRYGILYAPLEWLKLRGSWGTGYKVPTLSQLYRPASVGRSNFINVFDALRGNEPVPSPLQATTKGNPNLKAERSENLTAGALVDIALIPGLSLSLDYYQTQYIDRIGTLSLTDRIVLFPETVHRGPNRTTDPVGWAGPIIGFDNVGVNIASNKIAGYDIGLNYGSPTRFGEFSVRTNLSKTTLYEVRSSPTQPLTAASTRSAFPLQASGSLFLTRGPWEVGAHFNYRGRLVPNTLATAVTPSATRWDWQGSYRFEGSDWSAGNQWWTSMLSDARIALTIFNVFDVDPPFNSSTTLPDNAIVDSRLRRYALSISKHF